MLHPNDYKRYGVAALAVVLALVLRVLFHPILGDRLPLATLFFAVTFVAWYGGRGPATFTLILGLAALTYFILEPAYSFRVANPADLYVLLFYAVIGAGTTAFVEQLRSARAAAAAEAERFRVTLASIGDGVVTTDARGAVTFLNAVAENLTGWTLQQALGRPLKDVFRIVNEDSRAEVPNPVDKVLREGIVVGLANHTVLIARNGMERPIDDSAAPIRAADGSLLGVVLIFRDVSLQRGSELALRQSEQQLQLLADSIPQLAWMARPDGHIFWYNRRWYEYTGTTPTQMEGWGWQSVHDPRRLPDVLERWKHSLETGQAFDMVFPLRSAAGEFRSFLTRVNPLRDADGHIIYWFGTNTDVEDQERASRAVAHSEEHFRQLADVMPQIVWTAGPDGIVDYFNRQWYEFTGFPEGGGNEGWSRILHADDAPMARKRWAESLRSGSRFEMEFRLLDGRSQAYRWHLVRTVAIKDEHQNVVKWFGTATDIDEQKRAEETSRFLAQASVELATVGDFELTLQKVANLAVPYFSDWAAVDMANEDGSLRRLAVAHREPRKLDLVRQIEQDYPSDPRADTGAYGVLRSGQPQLISEIPDALLVQAARDERHLELIRSLGLLSYICVPLIVTRKAVGVLTFATAESGRRYTERDLDLVRNLAARASIAIENAELYRALREGDRRKDEFLATLAHELRNPLAPISNALQILKMGTSAPEIVERARNVMERQVHHLVRLVDDLLDVSRVTAGKIELHRERVELALVIARAVEMAQPLLDSQGQQLSLDLPASPLVIDADPLRIAQVVGNLLTNAAKYSHPRSRIELSAQRDGASAVLRVRDEGIGIAPHMLSRIFQLFVQADHATTKAQGGLGIGLTLARNLVRLHGGTIEAHSEGLGMGSEFLVRLPLAPEAGAAETPRPAAPSESGKANGLRLLVVDDNRDAATTLQTLLALQGYEVRVAFSGAEALELVDTYLPDVVFLDIGMPNMDGYETARRLRQQPGLAQVTLVAVTGWGQPEDRRKTSEAGFSHHLVKPPEPEPLAEVLSKVRPAS